MVETRLERALRMAGELGLRQPQYTRGVADATAGVDSADERFFRDLEDSPNPFSWNYSGLMGYGLPMRESNYED